MQSPSPRGELRPGSWALAEDLGKAARHGLTATFPAGVGRVRGSFACTLGALLLAVACSAPGTPAASPGGRFDRAQVPEPFSEALTALERRQDVAAVAHCSAQIEETRSLVRDRLAAVDARPDAASAAALRAALQGLMAATPPTIVVRGDRFVFSDDVLRMCAHAAVQAGSWSEAYLWLHELVDAASDGRGDPVDALQLAVAAAHLRRFEEAHALLDRSDVARLAEAPRARRWLQDRERDAAP